MSKIGAIISDFGGVLSTPLVDAFNAFQQHSGIPLDALGTAMGVIWKRDGEHPLFQLEMGKITEARFNAEMAEVLRTHLDRDVCEQMGRFREHFFDHLSPNEELIDYMRQLRERGFQMALCTNNVREWEPLWRAMLPVDEIFDVVVDSAFVGFRKPGHEIFNITLERLNMVAGETLFVDDMEINCQAARALGINDVWFQSNDQAIDEIEAALANGARLP